MLETNSLYTDIVDLLKILCSTILRYLSSKFLYILIVGHPQENNKLPTIPMKEIETALSSMFGIGIVLLPTNSSFKSAENVIVSLELFMNKTLMLFMFLYSVVSL